MVFLLELLTLRVPDVTPVVRQFTTVKTPVAQGSCSAKQILRNRCRIEQEGPSATRTNKKAHEPVVSLSNNEIVLDFTQPFSGRFFSSGFDSCLGSGLGAGFASGLGSDFVSGFGAVSLG
jgi:hypothetical protein